METFKILKWNFEPYDPSGLQVHAPFKTNVIAAKGRESKKTEWY